MAIYEVLFDDGPFCSQIGGAKEDGTHGLREPKRSLSLKHVLHILQCWQLAQLYPTQRRSKKYINHLTQTWQLSSADINIFIENQQTLLYQEIQI